MKKYVKSLLMIAGCIFASFAISNKTAYADEVPFSDQAFAHAVLSAYNEVNEVQAASVEEMTDAGLSNITYLNANILESASGIEKLTGLKTLLIHDHTLSGGIQKIDLSKTISIEILSINRLESLQEIVLPDESSLWRLEIAGCRQLKTIDLSIYDNLDLKYLRVGANNLNTLVLPKNTSNLEELYFGERYIETIDLSSLSNNFTRAFFSSTNSLNHIILPADWENNPDRDLETTLQFSSEELRNQVTITYAKRPAPDEDTPEEDEEAEEEDEEDTAKVPNTGIGINDMANKIVIFVAPFIFGIFIISKRAYKANKKRVRFNR